MPVPADRFSLVVLDMNGTTVEDSGVFQSSLVHAFDSIDRPVPSSDTLSPLRGIAKSEMFQTLIPDGELAQHAHDEFTNAFLAAVDRGAIRAVTGATDVLEHLRHLGLRTCLMTGFSHPLQRAIIASLGWDDLIDVSVSSDDVPHGRPHPHMIRYAADRMDVDDPARIIVVGDTINDLRAAGRAGAGLIVGVLSGTHSAEHLQAVPGTHLIASVADLPDLLDTVAHERAATS